MHASRRLCGTLAALPLLLLAACGGDEPAPTEATGGAAAGREAVIAPAPGPTEGPAEGPTEEPVPRLFVQIGAGGHLDATFGRWMGTGTFVAAGQAALRSGFLEVLAGESDTKPVLQIQALPTTPWTHIAAVIAAAAEPEVGLLHLDLRLPWDTAPKPVALSAAEAPDEPLRITFTPVRAGENVETWQIQVGDASFSLHAAFDDAARKKDVASIKALRQALQSIADAWPGATRRVEITLPAAPSPSYVNVLTLVRLCGERGFTRVRFIEVGE